MNELPNVEQSYSMELVRKSIHLMSLSIPLVYYFIPKTTALVILIPLTLLFCVSDVARLYHASLGHLFEKIFGFLLRRHERTTHGRRLTGATYVLISATICVIIFPKLIVVTAFAILIISDTSAALIGRKYGRHRFLSKSVEGSTAFLISALIVIAVAPKAQFLPMEYLIGAIAALVGAVVEASPIPMDDNLSIPLSIGFTMWLLYFLLLPYVNIFILDAVA